MKKATTTMLPILLALTAKKGKPPGKPEELESFQGFPPLIRGLLRCHHRRRIERNRPLFLLQESDGSKYAILNFPIASSVALLARNLRRFYSSGKRRFLFLNVVVDTQGFVQKTFKSSRGRERRK